MRELKPVVSGRVASNALTLDQAERPQAEAQSEIPSVVGPGLAPRMLDAAKARSSELQSQLVTLEARRERIIEEMQSAETPEAAMSGLSARLAEIDARISTLDAQVAEAEASVVSAAASTGSTVQPPPAPPDAQPRGVNYVSIVFILVVLCPIAIAYARRIWHRGAPPVTPLPQDVRDRLNQVSATVESIALEVERIGESQRFITRAISDDATRSLGQGAMQPVPAARTAEPVEQKRGDPAGRR